MKQSLDHQFYLGVTSERIVVLLNYLLDAVVQLANILFKNQFILIKIPELAQDLIKSTELLKLSFILQKLVLGLAAVDNTFHHWSFAQFAAAGLRKRILIERVQRARDYQTLGFVCLLDVVKDQVVEDASHENFQNLRDVLEAHELRYFQVGILFFFILFLNLICDDGKVAWKTVMLVPSLIGVSFDLISVWIDLVLHFKRLVEVALFDIVALGVFMELGAKLKYSAVDYDVAFEKSHEFLKF